jgi:hypothetical protein
VKAERIWTAREGLVELLVDREGAGHPVAVFDEKDVCSVIQKENLVDDSGPGGTP